MRRKEPTKAQRWARKRNWLKLKITKALPLFGDRDRDVLIEGEKAVLDSIKIMLLYILQEWESNNLESKANYTKEGR